VAVLPAGAVVLSTGKARHAASAVFVPETTQGSFNATAQNADPEFNTTLVSMGLGNYINRVFDTATLAFDLASSKPGVLQWQYVMGSAEYVFWTPDADPNTTFIDAFVMSVKAPADSIGTVLTKVPGTNDAVAISTVNWVFNNQSYIDNRGNASVLQPLRTTVKGLTTLFTTLPYEVQAGVTYTVKLVVADVGDSTYDTMVWVKSGSLQISCESQTSSCDQTATPYHVTNSAHH
jgi:hypothetical protein